MKANLATRRFEVLGVNDDRDFCECCGKTGLQRVVWIQDNELCEIKHFGTVCAQQPVKGFGPAVEREIRSAIRREQIRRQDCRMVAIRKVHDAQKTAPEGTYIARTPRMRHVYYTPAGEQLLERYYKETWEQWEATRKATEAERARLEAMTPAERAAESAARERYFQEKYGKWEDLPAGHQQAATNASGA